MGSVRSRISIPKKLTVIIISNEFSLWIINYGSHIEINYWVENSVNEPSLNWVWVHTNTEFSITQKEGVRYVIFVLFWNVTILFDKIFMRKNEENEFSECSNSRFIFQLTIMSIKSKNNSEKMKKNQKFIFIIYGS